MHGGAAMTAQHNGPGGQRPPRSVSMAVVLLMLTVIIDFTAAGWVVHLIQGDIDRLAARGSYAVEGMTAAEHLAYQIRQYRLTQAMFLLLGILVGFVTVTLSLFMLRGRRGARTAAWIVSGAMLVLAMVAALMGTRSALGLERDLTPSDVMVPAQAAAVAASYGLVIILLAMPQSHPFFARHRPVPPWPATDPYQR